MDTAKSLPLSLSITYNFSPYFLIFLHWVLASSSAFHLYSSAAPRGSRRGYLLRCRWSGSADDALDCRTIVRGRSTGENENGCLCRGNLVMCVYECENTAWLETFKRENFHEFASLDPPPPGGKTLSPKNLGLTAPTNDWVEAARESFISKKF